MGLDTEHVSEFSDSDVIEIIFFEVVLPSFLSIVADDSLDKALLDHSICDPLEGHKP